MKLSGRPQFHLQKVYGDHAEKPQIYTLGQVRSDWQMGRRGFLAIGGLFTGALAGCGGGGGGSSEPIDDTSSAPLLEPSSIETCAAGTSAHRLVRTLSIDRAGMLLASAGDGDAKIWQANTGSLVAMFDNNGSSSLAALAVSPSGKMVAWQFNDGRNSMVRLWDAVAMEFAESLVFDGHHFFNALAFSPDETLLAVAGDDGTVWLWNIAERHLITTLTGQRGPLTTVTFSSDGRLLAIGSHNKGEIWLWDVATGSFLMQLPKDESAPVLKVAFLPDDNFLASISSHSSQALGSLKLWEVEAGSLVSTLSESDAGGMDLAISPNGSILAGAWYDNGVDLWDIPSRTRLKTLHDEAVRQVQFVSDDIIVTAAGGKINYWNVLTGELQNCLFDSQATSTSTSVRYYEAVNSQGFSVLYTAPCGADIPPGATCVCDCVPGSFSQGGGGGGGGSICTCNSVCTCVPVFF